MATYLVKMIVSDDDVPEDWRHPADPFFGGTTRPAKPGNAIFELCKAHGLVVPWQAIEPIEGSGYEAAEKACERRPIWCDDTDHPIQDALVLAVLALSEGECRCKGAILRTMPDGRTIDVTQEPCPHSRALAALRAAGVSSEKARALRDHIPLVLDRR